MQALGFKKSSLSKFFIIAVALPIITTSIVALVADSPSTVVVNATPTGGVVVLLVMVHAATIQTRIDIPTWEPGSRKA